MNIRPWQIAALLVLAWVGFGPQIGGCIPTIGPSTPPLVVILYESEKGEPPAYAAGAVNELRKAGRNVRMMDDDPATGLDSVPVEVAPAIEPGRKIMGGTDGKGHALVKLAGTKVLMAVPLPASKEAIMEAAQ